MNKYRMMLTPAIPGIVFDIYADSEEVARTYAATLPQARDTTFGCIIGARLTEENVTSIPNSADESLPAAVAGSAQSSAASEEPQEEAKPADYVMARAMAMAKRIFGK